MNYKFGNKENLEKTKKELQEQDIKVDGICIDPYTFKLCIRWETTLGDKIKSFLEKYGDERAKSVLKFHDLWVPAMKKATGSSGNHQFWEGGYYDHVADCFDIAHRMWIALGARPLPFKLHNVLYVLYFHDIEKMWKYSDGWFFGAAEHDKDKFYQEELPERHNFWFSDDELNALKYIHGEGDDYRKDKRVMNPLAGYCHAVDVLSARTWPEHKL